MPCLLNDVTQWLNIAILKVQATEMPLGSFGSINFCLGALCVMITLLYLLNFRSITTLIWVKNSNKKENGKNSKDRK